MSTLLTFLQQQSAIIIGFLILINIALCIIVARNHVVLKSTMKKFGALLDCNPGIDLESMLLEHVEDRRNLQEKVSDLDSRTGTVEKKLQKSKRHVGLVRYDAFPDIGGNQSFALAIYDDNGDGAVISSIIGRADAKVYGKPILGGKADRNLTNEEQQAILEAVSTSPKSFLSK